jgi:hypothetical protein
MTSHNGIKVRVVCPGCSKRRTVDSPTWTPLWCCRKWEAKTFNVFDAYAPGGPSFLPGVRLRKRSRRKPLTPTHHNDTLKWEKGWLEATQ